MKQLLCLGLGYCARHYIADFGGRFDTLAGSTRTAAPDGDAVIGDHRVMLHRFDSASHDLTDALRRTEALLVSAAPGVQGDPVLRGLGAELEQAPLKAVVYLSTVGVYGDHDGAWIDESAPLNPASERSRERVAAERAWQDFGRRRGVPVALLRLAGIYGPGQNALSNVGGGRARRIDKPGQVFNRIHVADIAKAIDAAFALAADGAFNVTDDEPSPPGDPIVFAAQLLDVAPPPAIPFAQAAASMTPMALSFYGENKRVRNTLLKTRLGVRLAYPTYREGLTALYDQGEGR